VIRTSHAAAETAMTCPHCPSTLFVLADRQGLAIDLCAQCRSLRLARGELDALLAPPPCPPPVPRRYDSFESAGGGTSARARDRP
jgi:Zn-finger nucleic acid-binding protein